MPILKVLQDMKKLRSDRIFKKSRAGTLNFEANSKVQSFAPIFLFLRKLLILGHITYVLFVIAVCIEGRWGFCEPPKEFREFRRLGRVFCGKLTSIWKDEYHAKTLVFKVKSCIMYFRWS